MLVIYQSIRMNPKLVLVVANIVAIAWAIPAKPGDVHFHCIPGETFQNDCNNCVCDENGRNVTCTSSECTTQESDTGFLCSDGSIKKMDCNICRCIKSNWACTKKYCIPDIDILEEKYCKEGDKIKKDCNVCECVVNKGYVCDKKECP